MKDLTSVTRSATCYIYGLRAANSSDYFYVGSTKRDLAWRLSKHANHIASGLHRNQRFTDTFNMIGADNVVIDLLEEVNQDQRFAREAYWINALPNLVNIVKNPAKGAARMAMTPAAPRHPGGRPTKYTPETTTAILDAIRVGTPLTHACRYGGVSFETFNEWRKQYSEFSEQVKEAESEAVKGWLEHIETAARNGSWQAAAWKLERRYPQDFGRRDRLPIDVSALDRQFEAEMAQLESAGEGITAPGDASEAVN